MKKYFGLLLAACGSWPAFAQPSSSGPLLPVEYENRKSLSIGFTYQHMELNNLNTLLEQSGYGSLAPGVSCISIVNSVHYNDGLGFFYGADLGLNAEGGNNTKYKKSHYYRGEAGIEYRALKLQHLACFAHLGLGYGAYTLRLYDRAPDTSMNSYIKGSADGKRMQTGIFGVNIGFQSRIYLGRSPYLGFGAGCMIPFGTTTWRHDGGSFEEAPAILPGTWYAQVKLGLEFHRKIIRLKNDEEAGDRQKAPAAVDVL